MKLLLVEDNANVRRLITWMVSDLVDAINECCDGADALAAYTEYRPDWVFMDIKMERLDGIAATRQIIAAFPEAQIVMVTDYGDAKSRAAAAAAGACGYVLKENLVDLRQLLASISS